MLNRFADAFREVAAAIDRAVEAGERSAQVDAGDLVEAFLAVADRLDPPVGKPVPSLLEAARALLNTRDSEMVTSEEWDRLWEAVEAAERQR